MELGEKLRQARLEAGISQRQLCEGPPGISKKSVCTDLPRFPDFLPERGKNTPSGRKVRAIFSRSCASVQCASKDRRNLPLIRKDLLFPE